MRSKGFSLIELVLALGILVVVLGLAVQGIIGVLKLQASQEAITNGQAKLRRVVEVFSQDLRGAVLGSIINTPYITGDKAISIAQLQGGAGYPVVAYPGNTSLTLIGDPATAPVVVGERLFLVSGNQGFILPVTSVSLQASTNLWTVVHPSCSNRPASTTGATVFAIQTVGYSYDSSNKQLNRQTGATAFPAAYEITQFSLEYIYRNNSTGAFITNPTGYLVSGNIQQQFGTYSLQRVKISVATQQPTSGGKKIERNFSSVVEAVSNVSGVRIQGVTPCS